MPLSERPPRDRRPYRRGDQSDPRHSRDFPRRQPASDQEGSNPAWEDGHQPLLRGFDTNPNKLRDSRQTALCRLDQHLASTSSVVKGETLIDTARNLQAMAPTRLSFDTRHPARPPDRQGSECQVINAGRAHEHPTQALRRPDSSPAEGRPGRSQSGDHRRRSA